MTRDGRQRFDVGVTALLGRGGGGRRDDDGGAGTTDKEPSISVQPGKMAGRLRLMRRFVPEKMFDKSFRKQMGVVD